MKEKPGYSEALKKIESIINEIERETIDVDVLTEKVKTAIELIKGCKAKLRKTEDELSGILKEFEELERPEKEPAKEPVKDVEKPGRSEKTPEAPHAPQTPAPEKTLLDDLDPF